MPTVTAGNSADLILAIGEFYDVTTEGFARVDIGAGAGESYTVMPGKPFRLGPFVTTARVKIRAISGNASYLQPFSPGGDAQLSSLQAAAIAAGATPAAAGVAAIVDSTLIGPAGAVLGLSESTPSVAMAATGAAYVGACDLAGWVCTVAAGTITIYDNNNASQKVIVPTTTLTLTPNGRTDGRNEFNFRERLTIGCWVVLSNAAARVNILVGP